MSLSYSYNGITRLIVEVHYAPHSKERGELHAALVQLQSQLPIEIPCIVNGEPVPRMLHKTYLMQGENCPDCRTA